MKRLIWCLAVWAVWLPARADLRVSALFSEHAVLQRDVPMPVTGWGTPGTRINVDFAGQKVSATVEENGEWRATLKPLALANLGTSMTVSSSDGETVTFEDILVGDVWVAAGQSNMAFPYKASLQPDNQEFEAEKNHEIRFFSTSPQFYPLPSEQFLTPVQWEVATPESIAWKPAAAWFFAREIRKQIDVPIGIFVVARGGTMIQPFMPIWAYRQLEGIDTYKTLKQFHDNCEMRDPSSEKGRQAYADAFSAIRQWNRHMVEAVARDGELEMMPRLPGGPSAGNECGIYNACMHPFRNFPFKGILWYQGESNGGDNEMYYFLLKTMIASLRTTLNGGEFPVYVVQLAPYGADQGTPGAGDGSCGVRESQRLVCGEIPKTGLVVTLDIGNPKDIHPKNKYDVGKRLARWALNRDYGRKDVLVSGPLYKSQKIDGGRIILNFDYVGSGLMVGKKVGITATEKIDAPLECFAIAGEDRKFVRAEAKIVGNTVFVSSPEVPSPKYVRYAYSASPTGNLLYNQEGLPAAPFKTDPW